MIKRILCLNVVLALHSLLVAGELPVQENIDWPEFLSRHDLVWKRLPDRFESAAFLGNGQLGAMLFSEGAGREFKWQMGRSDVVFDGLRISIGDLVLRPAGKILSADMRLDLWNAEVRGSLRTDKGQINFRCFTHAEQMVNVLEMTVSGQETNVWTWSAGLAANPRKLYRKETLTAADSNAPPVLSREGEVNISYQPLKPSGGHATAWQLVSAGNGTTVLYASVGYGAAESTARTEARRTVQSAAKEGLPSLIRSHREWWHRFWPEGFLSVPDTRLESFYYIQMYKIASATRPGRPALDLMGPWFRRTPWAKIWWNLNIQLAYWPQLTGNRLELGQSLCELLDRGAPALAQNSGKFQADSAAVGRTTSYDCVGSVGNELCNLPWAVHNYWLQYRYTMDDTMLRERVYPLLKRSVNYYLHLLKQGSDGKLHLSSGFSPEYPDQPSPNPDCNIDLSLLRWGLETLLASCERLKLADPDISRWENTLANLTPYPQDENGLRISASVPFSKSHRHYSHLLMIYPLYIMTPEQPENRDLVVKSLKHWMGMPQALAGYSYTGAASISALLGQGDDAAAYLNKLLDSKIPPNTLYVEAGPCIETPLSAAASLNDMLLSSWGDRIRVFPGAPAAWKEIAFHNLRAQGAFLLSAVRRNGKTAWVRVKSLAAEPCRIAPGLEGTVLATKEIKPLGSGLFEVKLKAGEEAVLYTGTELPSCEVQPVPCDKAKRNAFGLPTSR